MNRPTPLRGEALEAYLVRVRPSLSQEDFLYVEFLARGWAELAGSLEEGRLGRGKLQRIIFGPRTEKTRTVCPPVEPGPGREKGPKPKGHGRRGSGAYTGARRVKVGHPRFQAGHVCEKCCRGKLRAQKKAGVAIRLLGAPPITATVWELERFRCDGCGEIYSAPPPAEAGTEKHDVTVGVTVALLRYGTGLPHHRLAALQESLGVPLPESTQWELVAPLAEQAAVVFEELVHHAAQSPLVHHDDTTMRVAELRRPASVGDGGTGPVRKGCFTTNVLAVDPAHPVALFFTGRQHAGENLADVLKHRDSGLERPIQMCDALSRNMSEELPTQLANCLVHGRREFVDIATAFPEQSRHVLEQLGEVYRADADAREQDLTGEERLLHHQSRSGPVMEGLHRWLNEQMDQKKAEPNSALGKAIGYLMKHWEALTLFLREPGVPLDNNASERMLKMAILHRKNSLGYKTLKGAWVGDVFMSLIQTCRLNGENPFDYLLAIARNADAIRADPKAWLPWTYPGATRRPDAG